MTRSSVLGIVMALLPALLLSGCWSRREIESLAFVGMAGLDKGEGPNKIKLTVQLTKPFTIGQRAAGGGGAQEKSVWIVSASAPTVFAAVRALSLRSPRRVYWAHARVIVIGEELARDGVQDIIDFPHREQEVRETAFLVVAKGASAAEVLEGEFELERLPSEAVTTMIELAGERTSSSPDVTVHKFSEDLAEIGIEPVAERIELAPSGPQAESAFIKSSRRLSPEGLRVGGAAAFKGYRLVGWLDRRQARGLLWLRGETRSGAIVIKCPGTPSKLLTVETSRASSSVKPRIEGGMPGFKITINQEGNIADTECRIQLNEEELRSINRRVATVIRNEIQSVLDLAQLGMNSDIFGFGHMIHQHFPKDWALLKDRWDEIFPTIPVEIDVRASVRRGGLVTSKVENK